MKKLCIIWALIIILETVPRVGAFQSATDERTYPLPVSETEEVVTEWLQQHAFQVYRASPTPQSVLLIVEKPNQRWRITLKPHSPLATLIRTEVVLNRDSTQPEAFMTFLDGYIPLPASRPDLRATTVPDLVRQYLGAVVCIFAQTSRDDIQFSGFFIDTNGLIVSTAHDLQLHQNVSVLLHDGREVPGRVVRIDPHQDLTLVKAIVAVETVIPLNNGRYLLDGKDSLFAVTCPNNGIAGIQSGFLDGLPRQVEGLPLWQVRMSISPGSSGSPVFDDQGRLAAVVKGHFRGTQTIGFLIPLETLIHFLEQH
jgi:serine protease Do